MLSLSTPEYAVRRIVKAISSAIDSSVFLNSSKPMGSRGLLIVHLSRMRSSRRGVGSARCGRAHRSDLLSQLDDDVAGCVEGRSRAGGNHAGRIVLLHDAGTGPRRSQAGAIQNRRLAPAEDGPEVHAAGGRVAAARAIDANRVGNAR